VNNFENQSTFAEVMTKNQILNTMYTQGVPPLKKSPLMFITDISRMAGFWN